MIWSSSKQSLGKESDILPSATKHFLGSGCKRSPPGHPALLATEDRQLCLATLCATEIRSPVARGVTATDASSSRHQHFLETGGLGRLAGQCKELLQARFVSLRDLMGDENPDLHQRFSCR